MKSAAITKVISNRCEITNVRVQRHIFLTGFMGTGKTTVGPRLASLLGLPFLDTDRYLEARIGKTIPQIFARKGESFFRKEETKLLLEFFQKTPHVLSLGGGIILAEGNRGILSRGIWINLKAMPATILKRVGSKKTRPLLKKKNQREIIEELLNGRRPLYDLAPFQIETDTLSVDGVIAKIFQILKMTGVS